MTERTQTLTWAPTPEASKRILFYVGIILVMISAIAFGISFDSVMLAARPVFGDAAWAIPLLLDATLAVLTAAGLVLELNGLRARLPQYFARVLIAVTVYANVEPARGLFPRIMHGAPPVTWAVLVLIAERTVRKLASLTAENQIEAIRRSLWLLRPAATLRIWRRMRIHQLATYLEGLDRDAARAAVVGRMRLHYGRFWKLNAPLAERIALRLEGRDPAGIAAILRIHTDTAAMLSGTYLEAGPQAAEDTPEQAAEGSEQEQPKPRQARRRATGKKVPKTPALRRTDEQLLAEAGALNALVVAETGAPVSVRRMRTEMRVGQPVAERIRTALLTAPQPAPDPAVTVLETGGLPVVAYANGAVV